MGCAENSQQWTSALSSIPERSNSYDFVRIVKFIRLAIGWHFSRLFSFIGYEFKRGESMNFSLSWLLGAVFVFESQALAAQDFDSVDTYAEEISAQIEFEYEYLSQKFRSIENPDRLIGSLYYEKDMEFYSLIWDKWGYDEDGHDLLRIWIPQSEQNEQDMHVTYIKSDYILPGRTVIRRFIGSPTGNWIADTIDANTLEYLGSQGSSRLSLTLFAEDIFRSYLVRPDL